MEEALYDMPLFQKFVGLDAGGSRLFDLPTFQLGRSTSMFVTQ